MDKPDKREKQRVPIELMAQVSMVDQGTNQSSIKGLTDNISAGGAFLHTHQTLPIGTEVDVTLILPIARLKKLTGKNATLEVTGIVVRTEKKGMAIYFTGIKILSITE